MSRPRHAFPITGDRLSGRLITPENRNWWTLAVPLGLFMIMLDTTVVSVALPAIRDSLHMLIPQGEPPLEWAERRYNIRTWTVTPKGGTSRRPGNQNSWPGHRGVHRHPAPIMSRECPEDPASRLV